MKKITLLMGLIAFTFGYSQELVTNGDFQTGVSTPWYNNAANVVDLGGGNYINEANTTAVGNPWDVNLSQDVILVDGATYELSFDAYTDATTITRTMVVGLGQNSGPWASLTETPTLTSTSQTFTYLFTINYGDAVADRVIFDMGAAIGFVFLDNVSVIEVVPTCTDGIMNGNETGIDCGGPDCTACPPTCTDGIMNGNETGVDCGGPDCAACVPDASNPSNPDTDVILSLFNDIPGYTNAYTAEGEFGVRTLVDLGTENDQTIKMDFSVDAWGQYNNTTYDLTGASYLNFQYYAPNLPAGTGGHEFYFMINSGSGEKFYTFKDDGTGDGTIVFDAWQTISIPMSFFTTQGFDQTTFLVWKLGTPSAAFTTVVYFDNIFFSGNPLTANEFNNTTSFNVYPNPSNNFWNIKANNQDITSIQVFDVLGKQVLSLNPNKTDVAIDATSFKNGLYFAKVSSVNGTKTIKLIKE